MSTSQVVSRLPKSSLLLDLISYSSVYEFYHSDRGVSSIRTVSAVAASLRSIKPLASVPPRDAACYPCVHLQRLADTVSESVEVHNYMCMYVAENVEVHVRTCMYVYGTLAGHGGSSRTKVLVLDLVSFPDFTGLGTCINILP